MENYRTFYEEVGERYAEEETVYGTLSGRLRKAFIVERIKSWSGSFLDIGCNRGIYLKGYRGGRKAGADLSFAVLKPLRRENPSLNLVVADAQALDCFRDSSFECILCSEVLEHVPLPDRVISAIHRLLKPNGRALITTPNYRNRRPEWTDLGFLKGCGIQGVKGERYFHTAFRPEELEIMGQKAGLRVVNKGTLEKEIRYAAKIPALIFIVFRQFNRWTFKSGSFDRINQEFYSSFTLSIYRILHLAGVDLLLNRWISEGVRSFIILEKSNP